jgi:phenylpropionate dioxygenase-like ring-hydroxylating dioxygenase large terminal subunit
MKHVLSNPPIFYPAIITLLEHISPHSWEHINLTGIYTWDAERISIATSPTWFISSSLQDRIILENQRPSLLPMGARAEIPTRADASSIAYRRWLKEKGITHGTTATAA